MIRYTPQQQQCLNMFRNNDNHVTTGMFAKSSLSCEYRKIISQLRQLGFVIPAPVLNRKEPGKNLYTLIEGKIEPEKKEQITQATEPCSNCGSFYRRGKECNICH